MKLLAYTFIVFLLIASVCFLCSQVSDTVIYDPGVGAAQVPQPTPQGLTFQAKPIPKATPQEAARFWRSLQTGATIIGIPLLVLGVTWGVVLLLEPLATGLDSLVKVLDRLRKVIFDSRMDDIQVRKSDRLSDVDVDIASARFEHDREKALIVRERLRDVTDIEVIEKANKLKMSQQYGQLMIKTHRRQVKREVQK